MDKVIKHRFWILLTLVLPMVIYGYYNANGAIKEATEQRESALKSAYDGIPTNPGPNDTYVKAELGGLEVYNARLREAVNSEMVRVWLDQQPRMTWPADMRDHGYVPNNYRGEFTSDATYIYRAGYDVQLRKLWESVEPLRPERNGSLSGKVLYDYSALPRYQFGPLSVPSELIWDAQEDIWFLQLLFDAIRNTNRPAENAAKAAVRRLNSVQLMGGDGQSTVMGGGGGGGIATYHDEEFENNKGGGGGMPMRMNMGQAAVAFNPSEEFGAGMEGRGGGAYGNPDEEDYALMSGRGPAGGGAQPTGPKMIRYIAFDENARYQERGFYMSVLIDQKKIADFLVELSNADWPIRIVRFNVGPNTGAGGMSGGSMMFGGNFSTDDEERAGMGRIGMGGFGTGGGGGVNLMAPGFGAMGGGDEELGMPGGGIGPAPLLSGDQIQDLFSRPDLVQLDLCGAITMYRPPSPELLAAATQARPADAAAPATSDGSADSDGDAAQPAAESSLESPETGADAESVPQTGEEAAADASSTTEAAGGEAEAASPEDSSAPAAEAGPAPAGG